MEAEWNEVTRRRKAAPIFIVNEVDNEPYPPVDINFKYYEDEYD